LETAGHDVVTAGEAGCAQASDAKILTIAQEQERILITRDRDFGHLVFVKGAGTGVIYLRLSPANLSAVHTELLIVLATYSEEELKQAFVVVEANCHRFRHLS